MATYTVIVDPFHNQDAFGNTLLAPCFGPCPLPFDGTHGTVEWDTTGLVTAVEPATCTWVDVEPLDSKGNVQPPSWLYVGAYMVTATYGGVTSQPLYIPVASSGGNQFYGGQETTRAEHAVRVRVPSARLSFQVEILRGRLQSPFPL